MRHRRSYNYEMRRAPQGPEIRRSAGAGGLNGRCPAPGHPCWDDRYWRLSGRWGLSPIRRLFDLECPLKRALLGVQLGRNRARLGNDNQLFIACISTEIWMVAKFIRSSAMRTSSPLWPGLKFSIHTGIVDASHCKTAAVVAGMINSTTSRTSIRSSAPRF
jgi:hypothetical protein